MATYADRIQRLPREYDEDTVGPRKPTSRRCGAKLRNRNRPDSFCKLPAGYGTDHPGVGSCRKHGGNRKAPLRRLGMELAHKGIMDPDIAPGEIIEITPENGLLWCVHIAAGDVAYWMQQVRRNPTGANFSQQRAANMQLAKMSKMAIDAGLAERQVALAEKSAHIISMVIANIFDKLDLTSEQQRKARESLEVELRALETFDIDASKKERPKLALAHHTAGDILSEVPRDQRPRKRR